MFWWSLMGFRKLHFSPRNPRFIRESGINSIYECRTAIKTCLGIYSTCPHWRSDDLTASHGAGAMQRGHFDTIFDLDDQTTMGAPEGPTGLRRVLRTMFKKWKEDIIFQHCGSARESGFRNGHLVSGDVISRQMFMISENHEGASMSTWKHS